MSLSLPLLIIIFLFSAVVIWLAGVSLAKAADTLDTRFGLGQALGGLILLGIAGSLPEIAVVTSAALKGHYDVIIGNLIGSISIKTLAIILFDFLVKGKKPLSYLAGSTILALEGLLAIIIVAIAIFGIKVAPGGTFLGVSHISLLIGLAWILGLFIIDRLRLIKRLNQTAEDASPGRKHHERRAVENHAFFKDRSTSRVILIFLLACLATLVAGFLLEETGTALAGAWGIGTGLFAATILSLITAFPEISSGIESVVIGDHQLSISDIFGGIAFMPVIFILADLLAKEPILPYATTKDIGLAILGIVMVAIFSISFMLKWKPKILHLGLDSILVIVIYIVGLILIF